MLFVCAFVMTLLRSGGRLGFYELLGELNGIPLLIFVLGVIGIVIWIVRLPSPDKTPKDPQK